MMYVWFKTGNIAFSQSGHLGFLIHKSMRSKVRLISKLDWRLSMMLVRVPDKYGCSDVRIYNPNPVHVFVLARNIDNTFTVDGFGVGIHT